MGLWGIIAMLKNTAIVKEGGPWRKAAIRHYARHSTFSSCRTGTLSAASSVYLNI